MNNFTLFIAPFLVLILSIVFAFLVAPKDEAVSNNKETE